jgi:hypothetical protein
MKLSETQLTALVIELLGRYRALVRDKADAYEMKVIAAVFGVATLLGADLPTRDDFLTRYWTTLGPIIYAPRGTTALNTHARVVFHELTHVVQFWRDPVSFVSRYLTAKGRAELEAEAERGAIEVWWLLTGALPPSLDALDVTRHGYALDDGHATLTRDLLDTACSAVSRGILSTDVGLAALAWLRANAPDAVVGAVHGSSV